MTFELLSQLTNNGFTPQYRTANPSRRATNSWILDISRIILNNDSEVYNEIFSDRVIPFFAKGAVNKVGEYFPSDRSISLERKFVVTATGKRYTVLYNSSSEMKRDAAGFKNPIEVFKWNPETRTILVDRTVIVDTTAIDSVRLGEKVTLEIEGETIDVQIITLVFKSEVNYTIQIAVTEKELGQTLISILTGGRI